MKLKRLILAGVAVVLLIACFICYSVSAKPIFAGQGSGKNEKVESVEELLPVLEFLIDSEDTELLFAGDDTQIASVLSSSRKKQHESATLSFTSSLNASSSSGRSSATQRLSKEMTVYITEDGTLYDTAGSFMVSRAYEKSSGELESSNNSMLFDMQILQIGSKAYVNFKELSVVTEEESLQIKHEYTNQWIKMPLDFIESIMSADMLNRSVLGEMGALLDYLIESEEIDEDESLVKLDEYDLRDASDELSLSILQQISADSDVKMIFDLSAADAPNILYNIYTYQGGTDAASNSYTYSLKATDQIIIQNINNTEINFDDDMVDLTIRKQKDFEKLFKHNK